MDDARTHYEVLEAPIDASDEALRRNYKRLSVAKHPDRNRGHGAHDEFCRLQEAWEALREPQARAEYDRTLPSNTDFLIWCEVKHGSLARDGSRLCYECRCGGEFELSDDELRGGIDIVPCDSCSLHGPAPMMATAVATPPGGIRGEAGRRSRETVDYPTVTAAR